MTKTKGPKQDNQKSQRSSMPEEIDLSCTINYIIVLNMTSVVLVVYHCKDKHL